jgi:uncharacterized secreted protein with C-terminal beta-propeller domain
MDRTRILVLLPFAAAALALSACSEEEAAPELETFADCEALDTWLDTSASTQVNYVYGGWGVPVATRGGEVMEDAGGAAPPSAPQDLGTSGSNGDSRTYSSTNVQVDGVDEADLIKNDGEHIYLVDASGLNILNAWPPTQVHSLSRTEIEGSPMSLFFDGLDTVVVFSQLWGESARPVSGGEFSVGDVAWDSSTKITVLDVSDRAAPVVEREIYAQGDLRASRRVGDRVHVVLTDYLYDRWEPQGSYNNYLYAQRQALKNIGAGEWIPNLSDHRRSGEGWTVTSGDATRCTDVYKPSNRTDLQFTTVLSFVPADVDSELQTVGVIARADTVYATADSLYFGMSEYESGPFPSLDGSLDSSLHKFRLTDDGPVYTASGKVPGTMLNQFSMDEHDGFLRIATTDWSDERVSNSVHVLEQQGTTLDVVGSVTGIEPDESIYAARFDGDRGYIVTFRQIDPLFTFDLSDPRDPKLVGSLEVTGFSNYLHPFGDDRLLAVGEEITAQGSVEGLQVSVFDVSDFADPRLEDRTVVLGQGWSEAQYDHHAFTFYEPEHTLALPIQRWGTDEFPEASLALFRVDEDAADILVPLEEVDHGDWLLAAGGTQLAEEARWCSQVRRSVFVGNFLYVVSNFGIQIVHLDSGRTMDGWLVPEPQCWWGGGVAF